MKKTTSGKNISTEQKTLLNNWERYRGNIVMVVGEQIFATKRASTINALIDKIEKKFHRRPLITFIPKEGTLVLFV